MSRMSGPTLWGRDTLHGDGLDSRFSSCRCESFNPTDEQCGVHKLKDDPEQGLSMVRCGTRDSLAFHGGGIGGPSYSAAMVDLGWVSRIRGAVLMADLSFSALMGWVDSLGSSFTISFGP